MICEISGYGASGPYRDKKAYDLLVQSEAGLVSITGTPETPSKVGISVADIAAGMYAFSSILAALVRRATTGTGALLDISMFDALAEWMGYPAYYTGYGGAPLPRTGARHAAIAPYGPYAAGDGHVVYLGLQNEREWARFCADVLEQPGLAADPRFSSNALRVEHHDELEAIIVQAFAGKTAQQVVDRLEAAQIANARMNTVDEFLDHPQLARAENGRWSIRRWDRFARWCRRLASTMSSPGWDESRPLGEHTDRILTELGIDRDTIASWRRAGIV